MRVDAIYREGRIHTLDESRPLAQSLAVHGGRIWALDEDVAGLTTERDIDLQGLTVVPGFHDAHVHAVHFGMSLETVDLSSPPFRTLDELYEAIAARAAVTPVGDWIVGSGYDQNKIGGHPERARLDAVAPGHLVWIQHASRHMCVVNSRVLDKLNLDQVPAGGEIHLGADGVPDGLVLEQAQKLVRDLVYPYENSNIVAAIGRAHSQFLREGITSVQEAGIGGGWIGHSPIEFAAYQLARDQGELRVRTTTMISADSICPPESAGDAGLVSMDLGIRTGVGDDWLRIGALKVFADGSLIGRTAAMCAPFVGEPGNTGMLQSDPEHLRHVIAGAHRSGWQVATHAIGDRAIGLVLDIYREMLAAHPRADHRHRIEHCAVTTDEAVEMIARLGVIPSGQGRFIGALGDGMREALGADRVPNCYRQRSFLDRGVVLPASSDRPVVGGAPLASIHDLVNQRTDSGHPFNPAEALTVAEALRAYTVGSAHAAFVEADRGSLEAGKLADFVVLGEDMFEVASSRIRDVPVAATVVGGVVEFDEAGLGYA